MIPEMSWSEDPLPVLAVDNPAVTVRPLPPTPGRPRHGKSRRAPMPPDRVTAMNTLVHILAYNHVCRCTRSGRCAPCKARAIIRRWPMTTPNERRKRRAR